MAELIEAVETWMVAEEGTPDMTHGDRKSELHQKQGRGSGPIRVLPGTS